MYKGIPFPRITDVGYIHDLHLRTPTYIPIPSRHASVKAYAKNSFIFLIKQHLDIVKSKPNNYFKYGSIQQKTGLAYL